MSWAEETDERSMNRTDVLRASPPMFESRFLDALSRVHPAVPVIIFVPVIVVLGAWSLEHVSVPAMIGLAIAGYALWTLFEYWLHRVVFHFEPEDGFGARMHWIIHGVHHDHPNDPMRLVMPPAVSIPLGAIVFLVLYLILGARLRARAGRRVLHRLPGLRHDPLLPAPLPPAEPDGQDAARTPHAPPLPGRHPGLRDQRAILGRGLPDLPARQAILAISGLGMLPAVSRVPARV